MNADGSDRAQLTLGSDPTFSPDGLKIAFVNRSDIWVVDADGSGTPTNLTNDAQGNISPAWSPNGTKIAFSALDEHCRTRCLSVVDADGSGGPTRIGHRSYLYFNGWGPAWSPDGSKIAFLRGVPSESDIFLMNPGSYQSMVLFDFVPSSITFDRLCGCYTGTDSGVQADPAFSPDGSKLAFRRNDDIWVGRIDGEGPNLDGSWTPTRLTSGPAVDTEPDWGPANFDLSLTQSDSPDPVKVNNNLTYTLKVKNEGLDTAPGVVLTDKLPSGVTFVSASSGCAHAVGKVSCKLGSVAGVSKSGGPTTLTRTITVKPTTQGTITNTASVKSTAQEVTYTDNNSDRERTEVTLNRAPVANKDFNGADAFTYKATDGTAQSNDATVTIVVRAVNDASNAQDDSAHTETNTPLDINVLSNDRDAERDEIGITEVSDPANGTATLNADGTIRYAPDTDYLGMPGLHYSGPDSFTYTVSDGNGATDTATVNIQVTDTKAPEAPVITSPANNTTDTDGTFTISGAAEPYTSVEIFDGGNSLNRAAAVNAEGNWHFELSNVSEGSHIYTVKAIDRAGNTSAASEALTVIVDIP